MKKPMTPRGYATLREELKKLKSSRPELAKAIEIARGHGDLSENADYDAAKNKSGMVEAKIRDIESRLSMAEIVDPRKLGDFNRVVFGVSVKIEDVDSGEEKQLTIVGGEESDVAKGWISYESPLGKGLIGKELGDVAKVTLPGGVKEYEIREIFVDYSE
jgi:transcription elongation factor GreA